MIVQCPNCSSSNRLPAARLRDKAKCAACKTALLPLSRPLPITSKEELDELLRDAPAPVVVDFWAAWCGPCKVIAPELEKLAGKRAGDVIVAKVDTDALPQVAERFGIRSIPTMIVFRGGNEADRVSGAMSASAIESRLSL